MKIGCVPVRGVLHALALLGVLRSGVQIYWSHNALLEVLPVFYIGINLFLIYAILKCDPEKLKWARHAVLICLILTVLPFLFVPVISASVMASGAYEDRNETEWAFGNHTTPKDRIFYGTIVGLATEFGMGILIAVETLKYFLVTRVWKAEESMKYLVDPSTFVPPV